MKGDYKMKIVPTRDNVVVTPCQEEEQSKIIVTTKAKPVYHKVVEVGDEVKTVSKDDKVLLTDFGGKHVDIDGNEYIIVKEDAILAKITE